MWKNRIMAFLMLVLGVAVAYFVYASQPTLNKTPHHVWTPNWVTKFPFRLGLDLSGGSHLVYQADTSKVPATDIKNQMSVLRGVLEERVNTKDVSGVFGVAENVVRVEGTDRISVELPGVTDLKEAVAKIGDTPILEFKVENPDYKADAKPQTVTVGKDGKIDMGSIALQSPFINTELTGRYLKKATLQFSQNVPEPTVVIEFNDEGKALFAQITKDNVGKRVAIFLDGKIISAPTVREAITAGQAVISGQFTPTEARDLVNRLNYGSLPMPISLLSTETVGPSLGASAVSGGVRAGAIGFLAIALFLILWYRFSGLLAVISLCVYISIVLTLFKLIPVTLTAAGVAGFIISLGLAVDANVLIFERIKEELRTGRSVNDSIRAGFHRAWTSIRDSNVSSLITALILWSFGTALIKGFALTLGIGVLVSLFSALTVSKLFLYALTPKKTNKFTKFLFSSGLKN